MSKQPTDSLSIIEDCLDRIYKVRRASLLSKSRKFKEKQSRKAFEATPVVQKAAHTAFDADLSGYADKEVLEELDIKYQAPPPVKIPYVKEQSRVAKQYEEQDAKALELFRAFCNDLIEVIEEYPTRIPEDDFRAMYCDGFIAKYLTQQFDKMMPSRQLSKIKRHTTLIVESFASVNDTANIHNLIAQALADCMSTETSSNSDTPLKSALKKTSEPGPPISAPSTTTTATRGAVGKMKDEPVKPTTDSAVRAATTADQKGKSGTKTDVQQPPQATAPTTATTGTEKQKAEKSEKQRIKAQYEQLMAVKKKVENHPDDAAIREYSALHADIQSVIDSIQKGKPVK